MGVADRRELAHGMQHGELYICIRWNDIHMSPILLTSDMPMSLWV